MAYQADYQLTAQEDVPASRDWGVHLLAALATLSLIFSWTAILGSLAILTQMALLAAIVFLKPLTTAEALKRCWPLMIVALLPPLSTLWSEEPGASLRYGVQLTFTFVIGITVAAVTTPRHWVRAVFIASFVICLICIGYGRRGGSAEGPVLIGILGSKNAMAVLAQLVLASALAVIFDRGQARLMRLGALSALPVAAFVLANGQSAGGLITAFLGVVLLAGFGVFSLLRPRGRIVLTIVMLIFLAPIMAALPMLVADAQDFSINVLRKDPGLTGRDYLWAFADRLISEKPLIGHGFRAIWLGDDSTTVGLLRWAGLKDGRGFHFHDTYREWAVDFGRVGQVLIIAAFAASGVRLLFQAVAQPSAPMAFMASMFLILAVRAKVEYVFMPFGPTTVLLVGLAAAAWIAPLRERLEPAPLR